MNAVDPQRVERVCEDVGGALMDAMPKLSSVAIENSVEWNRAIEAAVTVALSASGYPEEVERLTGERNRATDMMIDYKARAEQAEAELEAHLAYVRHEAVVLSREEANTILRWYYHYKVAPHELLAKLAHQEDE